MIVDGIGLRGYCQRVGRATRFRRDAHLRGNMAACLLIMLAAGPGSHCEWKCEIPSGVPPVRPLPPRSSRGFCAPRLQARAAPPTMGKKLSVSRPTHPTCRGKGWAPLAFSGLLEPRGAGRITLRGGGRRRAEAIAAGGTSPAPARRPLRCPAGRSDFAALCLRRA